ncbi:MAG: hypothetical protein KKB31_03915 [Nanoarchaeota archaeon]|nr:hypothetical protein [Nanoarchaeota archaeon]
MTEIKLGDKVRCKYTGFTGLATAKTEFINGCIQILVLPKADKNNKMPEEVGIDSQSLEVIEPKKVQQVKKRNGGAMRKVMRMRGF